MRSKLLLGKYTWVFLLGKYGITPRQMCLGQLCRVDLERLQLHAQVKLAGLYSAQFLSHCSTAAQVEYIFKEMISMLKCWNKCLRRVY